MNSTYLGLILSVGFMMVLLLMILTLMYQWSQNQYKQNQQQTKMLAELLNKSLTLLSTKDPLAYQQVAAMETSSLISDDPYVSMTDEAEAKRFEELTGVIYDGANGPEEFIGFESDEFSPPSTGALS